MAVAIPRSLSAPSRRPRGSQKLVCAQQKAQGFPEACLCPAEGQGVPRGLSAPSRRLAGAATPSEDTKTGSSAITVKSETNPL